MLRWIARKALERLGLYGLYSLSRKGPLRDDGWFRSFAEQESLDRDGRPLPYITYSAIEFLSPRIRPDMSIFEYGSGASTLWWAERARSVISCEHSAEWHRKMVARVPRNVTMIYCPLEYGGAYCKAITEYENQFDIVSIDGRDRVNCAQNCLGALKPDGVVLWDNSNREVYEMGYRFLRERSFRKIEFVGMCPIINDKSETSVFYRPRNCLGI